LQFSLRQVTVTYHTGSTRLCSAISVLCKHLLQLHLYGLLDQLASSCSQHLGQWIFSLKTNQPDTPLFFKFFKHQIRAKLYFRLEGTHAQSLKHWSGKYLQK
jgi:hypothetical protein